MFNQRVVGVSYDYYHARIIGNFYKNGELIEEGRKSYIWDKNKEEIKELVGLPYKNRQPIEISQNQMVYNATEIKIMSTNLPIEQQIISINLQWQINNPGIFLLPQDQFEGPDLFTNKTFIYLDCTNELLDEIMI